MQSSNKRTSQHVCFPVQQRCWCWCIRILINAICVTERESEREELSISISTCFFNDCPDLHRICISCVTVKLAMNQPKSSHGWRISVRKLTMEGGKRNLLFARLFANSRYFLSSLNLSTHTRSVYLSHETQSTDSENGLKVRSPV